MGEFFWDCPYCDNRKSYSEVYDAMYCEKCNVWLEEACSDSNCEYCSERPEKPNM